MFHRRLWERGTEIPPGIAEAVPAPTFAIDRDYRITWANEAAARLAGRPVA